MRSKTNKKKEQIEDYVWLDGSEISVDVWKSNFPTIYKTCVSQGILLPKDRIPVDRYKNIITNL